MPQESDYVFGRTRHISYVFGRPGAILNGLSSLNKTCWAKEVWEVGEGAIQIIWDAIRSTYYILQSLEKF